MTAVNCCSPTEDVQGNAPVAGAGGAWSAQVAEVRDRILADGIPAQTFAAGANAIDVFGDAGNYNYQNEDGTPNGWPRICLIRETGIGFM